MNEDDKQLIATELEVLAEEIRTWTNCPSDSVRFMMIKNLFEIMVQIKEA